MAGACLLRSKLRSVEVQPMALALRACNVKDLPKITQLFDGLRNKEDRSSRDKQEGSLSVKVNS